MSSSWRTCAIPSTQTLIAINSYSPAVTIPENTTLVRIRRPRHGAPEPLKERYVTTRQWNGDLDVRRLYDAPTQPRKATRAPRGVKIEVKKSNDVD